MQLTQIQLINNLVFLRLNEILAKRSSILYYSAYLFLFLLLSYYPFFSLLSLSLCLSLFSFSFTDNGRKRGQTGSERHGSLTRPVDHTDLSRYSRIEPHCQFPVNSLRVIAPRFAIFLGATLSSWRTRAAS